MPAPHASIFEFVRHPQDLLWNVRSLADDYCAVGSNFDSVLAMIGILAVTALIFWEIYERVSVFFSVLRGIDDRPLF